MMGSRSCLDPDKLNMIFEMCPKFMVEAFVESNKMGTLRAISSRLKILKMNYDAFEDGIGEVGRERTNIIYLSRSSPPENMAMEKDDVRTDHSILYL